jgi:hypothetical protein
VTAGLVVFNPELATQRFDDLLRDPNQLAVPAGEGGLNLGKGPVCIVLWVLILGFVAFLAITGKDTPLSSPATDG